MDYGTLANLSNPGQSPLQNNNGIVDIAGMMRWNNLANMQEQSLRSAMPLAAMDAQQQEQKMKEYMAGAPGRMDNINLSNMNAAEAVKPENVAMQQKLKQLETQLKTDQALSKQLETQLSQVLPHGAAYKNADENGRKVIREQLRGKTLNNHTFGQDDIKDDAVLQAAGLIAHGQPKEQVKKDTEQIKQTGAMERLKAKGITDMQIAEFKANHARELQSARLAQQQNRPLTASQSEALSVDKVYGDDEEGKLKYWFTKNQLTGSTSVAAGKAATTSAITKGAVPASGPMVEQPPKPRTVSPEDLWKKVQGTKVKSPGGAEGVVVGMSKDGKTLTLKMPSGSKIEVPVQNNVQQ